MFILSSGQCWDPIEYCRTAAPNCSAFSLIISPLTCPRSFSFDPNPISLWFHLMKLGKLICVGKLPLSLLVWPRGACSLQDGCLMTLPFTGISHNIGVHPIRSWSGLLQDMYRFLWCTLPKLGHKWPCLVKYQPGLRTAGGGEPPCTAGRTSGQLMLGAAAWLTQREQTSGSLLALEIPRAGGSYSHRRLVWFQSAGVHRLPFW